MASDETRRILKVFGVAVTDLEDAVAGGAPVERVARAAAEARARLREVQELIDRLAPAR
jgi:hypothetical protein